LPIFLVLLVITSAYGLSIFNDFIWDDYLNIVDNLFIQSVKNLPLVFSKHYLTAPSDLIFLAQQNVGAGEITYRPVVTLTYFLDFFIWRLHAYGYHLTNLLLHILNTFLVCSLAMKIRKNRIFALAAGLIFAAHPVQAEAVLIPAFREDLLACLFMLGSLLFYLHAKAEHKAGAFILSLLFYALGLFSKEMAITLPILILLYGYYFESDGHLRTLWQKTSKPLYGFCLVTVVYLWIWGVVFPHFKTNAALPADSMYVNILTMLTVFGTYIQWLIVPINVHPTLPDPTLFIYTFWNTKVVVSAAIMAACFWAVFGNHTKNKIIPFSILWFFIALLPVSNIIPLENILASRYLYVPCVGFCFIAAFFFEKIWTGETTISRYISRSMAATIGGGLLMMCVLLVVAKGLLYTNEISFRKNLLRHYPNSVQAHRALAGAYVRFKCYDDAITSIKKAQALNPGMVENYLELADIYHRQGKPDLAAQEMAHIRMTP